VTLLSKELEELEKQLAWTREQSKILDEIDVRLYKMKEMAEFARGKVLTIVESNELNNKIRYIQTEVELLEASLIPWEEVGSEVNH